MPVSIGEDDSLGYRHGLGEALKESGCALHAYVLMTNPVHLLLTPPPPQDVPRLINLARAALRASTSTKPLTAPARCGTAATRRHWCKKTPTCSVPTL